MSTTSHCTASVSSVSLITRASEVMPSGMLVHWSGGDTGVALSHVNSVGIRPPAGQAVVVRAKPTVVVGVEALASVVDALRGGAVTPAAGAVMLRPELPQAAAAARTTMVSTPSS